MGLKSKKRGLSLLNNFHEFYFSPGIQFFNYRFMPFCVKNILSEFISIILNGVIISVV